MPKSRSKKKRTKEEISIKPKNYMKLSQDEIESYKKKGMLDGSKINYRERAIIKSAKKSLENLCEIVHYSAKNNPSRLSTIFDSLPSDYLIDSMGVQLTGEMKLKVIVALSSMYLDDKFRNQLREGLEIGYICNSIDELVTSLEIVSSSKVTGYNEDFYLRKISESQWGINMMYELGSEQQSRGLKPPIKKGRRKKLKK
jgi:hypothetical protein